MSLCDKCAGLCCRYLALPIETPTTRGDFEDIRWYLAHEGISIFVEDDEWYINISTRCRFLGPDHRCDIYEVRPKICRRYQDDHCDYHSGDYGYDKHFTTLEQLESYMTEQGFAVKPIPDKPKKKPAVKVKKKALGKRH